MSDVLPPLRKPGLGWDGTISAGHVLQVAAMVVAVTLAYAQLRADNQMLRVEYEAVGRRVQVLETAQVADTIQAAETRAATIEARAEVRALTGSMVELKAAINRLLDERRTPLPLR